MTLGGVVLTMTPAIRNAIVIVPDPNRPGEYVMAPVNFSPAGDDISTIGEAFAGDDLDGLRAMARDLARQTGLPIVDRAEPVD